MRQNGQDRRQPLLPYSCADARAILLVLGKHLEDIAVGDQVVRDADGEWPRVHLRILERHLDIEMTEVSTTEPFGHAQLIAVRMADGVKRCLVVKAGSLHHECVALPVPHRVAVVREQIEFGGKPAPIGVDLPVGVADFIQDHRQPRRLDDLDRL